MSLTHRFWLVRHALVDAAALSYLYGTNDVPVCASTMAGDAPRYAALAARLPRTARLVCTPLSRTQITARAIIQAGYPAQIPVIDAAFVEQDFGDFQGLPIAGFDARTDGTRHPFWPIHAAETPPGGESFDVMIARVGAGLERLAANATDADTGTDTVIISHGGAIRAACAYAMGLSAHQALCFAIDNISLTRLERQDKGWRILSVNEHLSISTCETASRSSPADGDACMKHPEGAHR
ncbi:MAG: histidine phosphatase family protein [Acidocella sp.]|nr:histidine phosphatase family protein [Acidocella sp.]